MIGLAGITVFTYLPPCDMRKQMDGLGIESRLAPDDEERQCECCTKPMAELGFDAQERFIYQPARVTIAEKLKSDFSNTHAHPAMAAWTFVRRSFHPSPFPAAWPREACLRFW